MSGRVYYIGVYSGDAHRLKRKNIRLNPAGTAKMDYIVYALKSLGKQVTLLSAAGSRDSGFCKEERLAIDRQEERIYLPSVVFRVLGKNIIRGDLVRFFLKRYFLRHIGSEDTVIVYHSLLYGDVIAKLRKRIGFKLILEVEEIYQDVITCPARTREMEWRVLRNADAYLFSTEKLRERLDAGGLPAAVVNGNYLPQKNWNESFRDGKCHCVYSGTFEPTKGAAMAAAAAEFLPEQYHIHILGFGTPEEKNVLLRQIEETAKKSRCGLSYDGLLSGEEFIRFLQKCHIGLSTQIVDARYADTSFPSKISTYLANGLHVVSGRIPALEQSELGEIIHYCDTASARDIAAAIQAIDTAAPYDSRNFLRELDSKFQRRLDMLLCRL